METNDKQKRDKSWRLIKNKDINLYNRTYNKFPAVIEYIKELSSHDNWSMNTKKYFNDVKQKAITMTTANEALDCIGYRFGNNPKLIEDCWNMEK